MAKKRRKKGQPSQKQSNEESKNFGLILLLILGSFALIFIILRNL